MGLCKVISADEDFGNDCLGYSKANPCGKDFPSISFENFARSASFGPEVDVVRSQNSELTSSFSAPPPWLGTPPEAGLRSAVFVADHECISKTRAGRLLEWENRRNCANWLEAAARPATRASELFPEAEKHTCFHPPKSREDTALATGNCARLESCPPKPLPTVRHRTKPVADSSKTHLVECTPRAQRSRTHPPERDSSRAPAPTVRLEEAPGSN